MKLITTILSAGVLAVSLGAATANAMPQLAGPAHPTAATSAIEPARLVCNYRHCFHAGYGRRYYYRPYGYYRPYYYAPHVGIGLGGFGIGVY